MRFRKNAHVIARREGAQMLAFHQDTGWICILNPGATFIWENFSGDFTPEQIVDRIGEEFVLPEIGSERSLLDCIADHLRLMQTAQLLDAVES